MVLEQLPMDWIEEHADKVDENHYEFIDFFGHVRTFPLQWSMEDVKQRIVIPKSWNREVFFSLLEMVPSYLFYGVNGVIFAENETEVKEYLKTFEAREDVVVLSNRSVGQYAHPENVAIVYVNRIREKMKTKMDIAYQIWMTLFHELYHHWEHHPLAEDFFGDSWTFPDDEDGSEREAEAFASCYFQTTVERYDFESFLS